MNSDLGGNIKEFDTENISDGIISENRATEGGFQVFERSGLAALSDLGSLEWSKLFSQLEKEQYLFLNNEAIFKGQELSCPRDPLHQWSRVWEYPYAYHHIIKFRREYPSQNSLPHIIDFGSGVSFFPFAIAKLGFKITCIDIDPICEKDMNRAIQVTRCPNSLPPLLTHPPYPAGSGVPPGSCLFPARAAWCWNWWPDGSLRRMWASRFIRGRR